MSTILKALRRLEHEKSSQAERPLREQVASAPETKRGIPITLAVGAVFAAGLALGAAALMLWPRPDQVVSAGRSPAAVAAGPGAEASSETADPWPEPRAVTPPVQPAADLPTQAFASSVAVVERESVPDDEQRVIELTATPPVPGPPPEGLRPAAEAMKPKPRFRPPASRRQLAQPAPTPGVDPAPASPPSLAEASAPAVTRPPVAAVPPAKPARAPAIPEGVRVASADRPAPPPPGEPIPDLRPPRVTQSAPAENAPAENAPAENAPAENAPAKKPAIPEITPKVATPPAPAPRPDPKPVEATRAEPTPASPVTSKPAEPATDETPAAASPTGVQVARTHWHPLPDKRIAVVEVEGRPEPLQLHEGDLVGSLVVGTIQPSGVVFLRDGVEVRRAVGAGR